MRTYGKYIVLFVLFAMLVSGLAVIQAQDTTTSGTINCDSDVMLNLAIAERFFGYGAMHNQMLATAADPSTVLDHNLFNRGQYGSLYGLQQTMMDPSMPNYGILSEQQFNNITGALTQDDAALDSMFNITTGFDSTVGSALAASAVAGEAAECTLLRHHLNRFFRAVLSEDVASGMMIGQGMNGGMSGMIGEMTPEASG